MTQNLINHGPKIALFEPDIPQNTAAIIRTCACLGAKLEIIEPCGFMLSDRRFKRVVMDYMNEKDIKFHQSSDDFFKSKKDQRIVLMTTKPLFLTQNLSLIKMTLFFLVEKVPECQMRFTKKLKIDSKFL